MVEPYIIDRWLGRAITNRGMATPDFIEDCIEDCQETDTRKWPIKNPTMEDIRMKINEYHRIPRGWLQIKKVVFNAPATIVFWADGTKTVVKCSENEAYDPEKGLMAAVTKKAFGNLGNYYNNIKNWLPKKEEETQEPVPETGEPQTESEDK